MSTPETRPDAPTPDRCRFQYSLRAIFGLTTGTAAFFAIGRMLGYVDAVVILAGVVVLAFVEEWQPMRFGSLIMGTLGGALLVSYGGPSMTDGPSQDLWLAEHWFHGAVIGALSVVIGQIVIRACRGNFRARLSAAWLVELLAISVIVAGFGQNWHDANSYYEARREWFIRYSESLANHTLPGVTEPRPIFRHPPSLFSSAITCLSKVLATVGVLLVVCGLFASLARLEKSLWGKTRSPMPPTR
ncbi:MAG: hypothetical protein ACLP9L_29685 [Thermoguttaceae bacterium]